MLGLLNQLKVFLERFLYIDVNNVVLWNHDAAANLIIEFKNRIEQLMFTFTYSHFRFQNEARI